MYVLNFKHTEVYVGSISKSSNFKQIEVNIFQVFQIESGKIYND